MQKLPRPPARYFLVASCSLLPQHKEQIKAAMAPYLLSTADTYGAEDIEALFQQHPALYARHHRLWLHSFEQLQQQLYAASFARSEAALDGIFQRTQNFVNHPQVDEVEACLATRHACLVVGDPGSGKTTTAAEIALRHYLAEPGLELHWFADRSFDEALNLVRSGSRQLFVLDDCFGATFLTDDVAFKHRQSWTALLRQAAQSNGDLRLLFTTRDYILQQALRQMEQPGQPVTQLVDRAVRITADSAAFRVEFVLQTLAACGLSAEQTATMVDKELYWPMICDARFSPRMLELLCAQLSNVDSAQLEAFIICSLASPHNLWRDAYERLSEEAQTLTLLVGLTQNYNEQGSVQSAFLELFQRMHGRHSNTRSFEQALLEVEPMFIKTRGKLHSIWLSTANPGVNDFVHTELNGNKPLLNDLIACLPVFAWGIDNFAISVDSQSPVRLNATQSKQLLEKLLELLPESGNELAQMRDTAEWTRMPTYLGTRLAALWQKVQHDPTLSQWLYERLEPHLPAASEWASILQKGDMATLLDLSQYTSPAIQADIWQAARNNLQNSEDAAALAEFYAEYPLVKGFFGNKKRLAEKLMNACMDEADSVVDPYHLEAIMHDLYRIESALGANISDAKHLIYQALDPYENEWEEGDEEMTGPTYYTDPLPEQANERLIWELAEMRGAVRERVLKLGGH